MVTSARAGRGSPALAFSLAGGWARREVGSTLDAMRFSGIASMRLRTGR